MLLEPRHFSDLSPHIKEPQNCIFLFEFLKNNKIWKLRLCLIPKVSCSALSLGALSVSSLHRNVFLLHENMWEQHCLSNIATVTGQVFPKGQLGFSLTSWLSIISCIQYIANINLPSVWFPLSYFHDQATDSECEEEPIKHSFVNHYMSDPSYFNSWKRQQQGLKQTLACSYDECASGDTESYYQTVVTQHSVGGVYTPTGQPASGSRTPVTGFSSFVWHTRGPRPLFAARTT